MSIENEKAELVIEKNLKYFLTHCFNCEIKTYFLARIRWEVINQTIEIFSKCVDKGGLKVLLISD